MEALEPIQPPAAERGRAESSSDACRTAERRHGSCLRVNVADSDDLTRLCFPELLVGFRKLVFRLSRQTGINES